jgi:deoxyribose-phosphate aldolase
MKLNTFIDHTLLKQGATMEEIKQLCDEARAFEFAAVCVNPSFVSLSKQLLSGSAVRVCTVAGFPLGATSTRSKLAETRIAIDDGAHEIDMVIHVGMLKSGAREYVKSEITSMAELVHSHNAVLKVIIETALLSDEEKILACNLASEAGADFVKTSTGFAGVKDRPSGATVQDVALMKNSCGLLSVKASGGIRTLPEALAMINAGATRIGTSSGVALMKEFEVQKHKTP